MFNKYSYKQKNRFLIVGVLILAFISYKLAFINTIRVYREMKQLETKLQFANNIPQRISALSSQRAGIDHILSRSQRMDTTATLLGIVTDYCRDNNIILKEFPKAIQKQQGEYLVETNFFIVEGTFIKMLELLYLLEKKSRLGKVASSCFYTNKDNTTKAINLSTIIYIQNVKKIPV